MTPDIANYDGKYTYGEGLKGKYREETTEVGSFPANAFGLYDMHGNVWEWCADSWHENYISAPMDGSVWTTNGDNKNRIIRGGSWHGDVVNCRSAYRHSHSLTRSSGILGFRVVCSSPRI